LFLVLFLVDGNVLASHLLQRPFFQRLFQFAVLPARGDELGRCGATKFLARDILDPSHSRFSNLGKARHFGRVIRTRLVDLMECLSNAGARLTVSGGIVITR